MRVALTLNKFPGGWKLELGELNATQALRPSQKLDKPLRWANGHDSAVNHCTSWPTVATSATGEVQVRCGAVGHAENEDILYAIEVETACHVLKGDDERVRSQSCHYAAVRRVAGHV